MNKCKAERRKDHPRLGACQNAWRPVDGPLLLACCKECELGASLPACVSTLGAEWDYSEPLSTVNRADPHLPVMSG